MDEQIDRYLDKFKIPSGLRETYNIKLIKELERISLNLRGLNSDRYKAVREILNYLKGRIYDDDLLKEPFLED